LHPASRILTYLMAALVIPGLPFFMLPIPLIGAFLLLVHFRRAPARLIWRTRWLLLVLLVGYAYGLPGQPLVAALGDASPSLEGLLHGAQQALRLLILLLWLDILVLAQGTESLLGGLYQILQPLARLGVDGSRAALRLGLTLKAIEGMERGHGNLLRLLEPEHVPDLPERVRVQTRPARAIDLWAPMALLATMVGLWLGA
jgi:hypothetical protein